MRITVLTGSPHRKGTSALLAERFIAGAEDAGHEVFRFDAAFEEVHPCLSCGRCRIAGERCVHRDEMDRLMPNLLAADLVVFATPLYYFGMPAPLKAVVDRFYSVHYALTKNRKRAVLLVTAADGHEEAVAPLRSHYQRILSYLSWEDAGVVAALGCSSRGSLERTRYPEQAYQLGRCC